MGQVVGTSASKFSGLQYAPREKTGRTTTARRGLNVPSELKNVMVDEFGHLWYPPAGTSFLTFTGTRIRKITNFTGIRNTLLVQVDDKIYCVDTTSSTPTVPSALITLTSDDPVWVNAYDAACYVGNSSETWKITYSAGYAASDITLQADMKNGFHSYSYRGRRFVCERLETVWFSDLNDPETFQATSFFTVGGDSDGDAWKNTTGSLVGVYPFGEMLLIFLTQSIHIFTGTDPLTNFVRRSTSSHVGAWSRDSITQTPQGIFFFGGTPKGEFSVYRFTGNTVEKMSEPIDAFFKEWGLQDVSGAPGFDEANLWAAERWRDNYIFAAPDVDANRDLYVFDQAKGDWSTFTGFSNGTVALTRYLDHTDRLLISDGLTIYEGTDPMFRAPGEAGTITLGYYDKKHPTGRNRYLAVKVSGWTQGSGTPTLTVTATLDNGGTVTSAATALPSGVFSELVIPIDLRGSAIELELTITPTDDTDEVLIEEVLLISSRKGEKVAES